MLRRPLATLMTRSLISLYVFQVYGPTGPSGVVAGVRVPMHGQLANFVEGFHTMGGSQSVQHTSYLPPGQAQSVEFHAGEGPAHRAFESPDALQSNWDPALTDMAKVWNAAAKKFANCPCMGTRTPATTPDGPVGPYTWKTYSEINERVINVASGLRSIGMQPGEKLGVYAKNNEDWVVSEQATYQQSLIVVSIYDTLGPDTCEYVLNHGEVSTLIAEGSKFKAVMDIAPKCPGLKNLIMMGPVTSEQVEEAKAKNLSLYALSDVEARGKSNRVEPSHPAPGDLCTIMYTSGTTGMPKGVMLSHANILACVTGAYRRGVTVQPTDVYLSYLPLSHIMERVVLSCMWSFGGQVAFYQGNPRKIAEDLAVVQPTILIGVPRVFNLFYEKVMGNVKKASAIKRWLFNSAYSAKDNAIRAGTNAPRWDSLVFKGIRETIVGPRCRLIISGSAPLTDQVQQFLRILFNCPVLQGYGLTETAAASTLSLPSDVTNCVVGSPITCSEIKLEDVPEMNYTSRNTPQQGEVLIRGLNVFSGYYKNKEETDKVLQPDGWFHTGDIGEWTPTGALKIIDRRKNIFKLSQGEYVASEKLEGVFAASSLISQIFIYGSSTQSCILAVVVPNYETITAWAATNLGKTGEATNMEFIRAVCKAPQLNKAIMADITSLGKAAKLVGYEFPKKILVESELFSVENDLLTPTFKLRRPALQAKYRADLDALYEQIAQEGPAAAQ
eukprot:TRINITY_DN164_c0_g3_i1.p1 TRINITY_DN164_c0_g3~~TRINITY_DN164_c0_g3_i1.p1  ORF type:complete len:726 (-),score=151.83 TRINITY_DN164_c0_g3_i1:44-2221(-)